MNSVIREQKRCRELAAARRHIQYLEARLNAAGAEAAELEAQVGQLVASLDDVSHAVIRVAPQDFIQSSMMQDAFRLVLAYAPPVPVSEPFTVPIDAESGD